VFNLTVKDWILCVLALTGSIGSLLYVDEFDELRMFLLSFVAMPGLVFWFFMKLSYPHQFQRFQTSFSGIYLILMLIFMWGNILLLNAVGDGRESVEVAEQIGTSIGPVAHYRGPLGLIYRSRF
jgi:hypothetical protein